MNNIHDSQEGSGAGHADMENGRLSADEPRATIEEDTTMRSTSSPRARHISTVLGTLAGVCWLASDFFLFKWLSYWSRGALQPGPNTSGHVLFVVFFLAFAATIWGLHSSYRSWAGKTTITLQVISLITSLIVLWMVCGD